MPGGPDRGERGEDTRVLARRGPRLAGVCAMLAVLGAMAVLGYDHRRTDMGVAGIGLSDGRVASIETAGDSGPTSLLVVGHSSATLLPLPPVLAHSTSARPARGPDGFALSTNGWAVLRLGRLGLDTQGGEITEISPTGETFVSVPLLRWRSAAIVGVTDQGLAIFRTGTSLDFIGPDGEQVPLLDLRGLGVRSDVSNLADVAVAPDGRIAVLVGDAVRPGGYRLFQRAPGGTADRTIEIPRAGLVRAPTSEGRGAFARPAVAFAGRDVIVAGDTGLVRVREGHLQDRVPLPAASTARSPRGPLTVAGIPGDRWMLGFDRLVVLDRSGQVHHLGFGPCPADPAIRTQCPAVLFGHRLPSPSDVLPEAGAAAIGAVLLGLAWAGRMRRRECVRLRLAITIVATTWVTGWLLVSLGWSELHGAAPLIQLSGAALAILTPAFPGPLHRELGDAPGRPDRSYQPWVPDVRRTQSATGPRRLEVVPLPSAS